VTGGGNTELAVTEGVSAIKDLDENFARLLETFHNREK